MATNSFSPRSSDIQVAGAVQPSNSLEYVKKRVNRSILFLTGRTYRLSWFGIWPQISWVRVINLYLASIIYNPLARNGAWSYFFAIMQKELVRRNKKIFWEIGATYLKKEDPISRSYKVGLSLQQQLLAYLEENTTQLLRKWFDKSPREKSTRHKCSFFLTDNADFFPGLAKGLANVPLFLQRKNGGSIFT